MHACTCKDLRCDVDLHSCAFILCMLKNVLNRIADGDTHLADLLCNKLHSVVKYFKRVLIFPH